jgi:hypothetical protein
MADTKTSDLVELTAVVDGDRLPIDDQDDNTTTKYITKKNLVTNIVNADINASAAIAKTKLAALDIVNADVNASAAIAYSKLAALTSGNIIVGSASNVPTSVNPSGDVDVSNTGVFSINSGVIVDADINASAAIAASKLSGVTTPSSTDTFTNKTFDANGTGNSITNIENADISATAAIAITKIADGTAFQRIRTNSGATANEFFTENATIAFVIDGGGSAITTGVKGYIPVGFDCQIDRVEVLADQTGSIVIDIWKDTYANYPPTDADSITASAVPTISSSNKDEDETLTGWTTTISQGDILGFNVDSASTITRATIALRVIKRG